MRTETKYCLGLKELMKTTPLDEINVISLCKCVKSNRQTFYYHYRDISDVIESILLKNQIKINNKHANFESFIKPLLAYINQDDAFLFAVANSFASDKLDEFLYSYFAQQAKVTFEHEGINKRYNTSIIISSLRCISTIFSREISHWILTKKKEKQAHLIKRLNNIWNYFSITYNDELKAIK